MASGDLRRLVAAVEALELQVRQLTAEVRELSDRPVEPETEQPVEQPPVGDPRAEEVRPDEPSMKSAANEGVEPDLDAARIVALNMALDDKPRDEVAAYIRDELGIEDSGALLDDVYARVG